jgi:hypothetical protein
MSIGTAASAQVDRCWVRLQFSGRLRPRANATDEADMPPRMKARLNKWIGYVTVQRRVTGVLVVLRLTRTAAAAAGSGRVSERPLGPRL